MKYIVLIFLLYFAEIFSFSGSTALISFMHFATLGVGICAFLTYILKYKWSYVTFFIFLLCFVYPIYAGIRSYVVFGQPIYLGVASLRYIMFILFGYFLILINYDYRLLIKQVNYINLSIATLSIIAILILHINPYSIMDMQVSTNEIIVSSGPDSDKGVGGVEIRGARFAICSMMMFASFVYYTLSSLKIGGKKNWIPFFIFVIYLLFVHKGRQPVAIIAVIYLLYFVKLKGLSNKKILMLIFPVLALIVLLAIDDSLLLRFTTILDGKNSQDFSTLARIWEVDSVMPYIEKNFFFGIGNLSPHFRNGGFQTFFGHQFYMSDIGIVAVLATGGLMLILIYAGFYISLWKSTKLVKDRNIQMYMRYMIITYAMLLIFFFNDYMIDGKSIMFALLFYPLFRRKEINKYFRYKGKLKDLKKTFI